MKSQNWLNYLLLIGLGTLLTLFVSGCINISGLSSPKEAQVGSTTKKNIETRPEKPKKTTAIYHDFEDVLVPMELKVVKDLTVIVETPGFRSGILTLKGMVDITSLYNFFSNNMEKDNWQVVSKIKSPGTTIMVFQKTARCAVITIRDGQINTYVEIGVAPTLGGGKMGDANLTY